VLKITNPIAGDAISSLWRVVRRGMSIPLIVDLTSSMELPSGDEPSVFIPTCAETCNAIHNSITAKNTDKA
jgi:hypothetical protein